MSEKIALTQPLQDFLMFRQNISTELNLRYPFLHDIRQYNRFTLLNHQQASFVKLANVYRMTTNDF